MAGDGGENVRTSCQGVMVHKEDWRRANSSEVFAWRLEGGGDPIHFFVGRRSR